MKIRDRSGAPFPVTAIIPHWNRFEDLKKCLCSLQNLRPKPRRIIIVDDHSLEDVREKIVRELLQEQVKLIAIKKRVGTAECKNVGLMYCRDPFVWFLDSDCEILSEDALKKGYELLTSAPDIGVVGGELVKSLSDELFLKESLLLGNYVTRVKFHPISTEFSLKASVIPTNNFLAGRSQLIAAGGFCPLLAIGEDKLLCLSLRKSGYRLLCLSSFRVLHHVSPVYRPSNEESQRRGFGDNAFIFGAEGEYWRYGFPWLNLFSLFEETFYKFFNQFENRGHRFKTELSLAQPLTSLTWNWVKSRPRKLVQYTNFQRFFQGVKWKKRGDSWSDFEAKRFPGLRKYLDEFGAEN